MEGASRWFISRDRRLGKLKELANLDRPAGCWNVQNRKGHDVLTACGSQLRWATSAPTEFANADPPAHSRLFSRQVPRRVRRQRFCRLPDRDGDTRRSLFGNYAEFR